MSPARPYPAVAWIDRAIGLLDRVPYSLLALPLRVGAAAVFWNSAQTKLANWDTTLELFAEEYKVPLLPPEQVREYLRALPQWRLTDDSQRIRREWFDRARLRDPLE